jgi:hypothetical protein
MISLPSLGTDDLGGNVLLFNEVGVFYPGE